MREQMKNQLTELVCILDRSGSMSGLESDTIGGFNHFLKSQQREEGEAVLTTILFDHETKVLHDRCPVRAVRPLTEREYVPRGSTALLDAVGGTLRHVWKNQQQMLRGYRPGKTIVMIITDGYENSSCKYNFRQVQDLIHRCKKAGWEFLFLGANMDAVEAATHLGMEADDAANFVNDAQGQKLAYECISNAVSFMRQGNRRQEGWKEEVEGYKK
ncbi:vWA domain-containing protein [Acidaminococcus timonensis]|uniref:vWA domain-containing protein n=1 Tax=Acidaminococcus timonensis TaxID=1871002 RepID=UPI0025ED0009|nr:vWA domain-containing protein [Acidaminococcus timonensis]